DAAAGSNGLTKEHDLGSLVAASKRRRPCVLNIVRDGVDEIHSLFFARRGGSRWRRCRGVRHRRPGARIVQQLRNVGAGQPAYEEENKDGADPDGYATAPEAAEAESAAANRAVAAPILDVAPIAARPVHGPILVTIGPLSATALHSSARRRAGTSP